MLESGRGLLTCNGAPVPLGNRAMAVLQALVQARGDVVTKDALMASAWPGVVVEEANLSVQVAAVRKALGAAEEARNWVATVARVGYRFTGPVQVEENEPEANEPGRSCILVLPFANLSGDPAQEYFADGITEEIITALGRFRWFWVISRNASFALRARGAGRDAVRALGVRYVMEGTVRRSGSRIRITAALGDAASANRIWAARYDFDVDEVLTVQDRIVEQVAGEIEPELLKSEGRRPARHGGAGAWELVRQGTHHFHQVRRDSHLRARELFRAAIAMDADLADAHVWLARVSAGLVAYGWSDAPAQDLQEGVAAALGAIHRDEQSPYAHYALAITSAYAGDSAQACRAAQRAIRLNPGFALGHLVLGLARLFAGQAASAAESLERGLTLNPHDPQNFVWYIMLAFAWYFAGQPERALEAAERASDLRPAWRPAVQLKACAHRRLGRMREAERCAEEAARLAAPTDRLLEPLTSGDGAWRALVRQIVEA
jgi:TolB-like protein